MPNRRRGEVGATLDGRPYSLCLTLGALAELEDSFAVADLTALGTRFASGRLSAGDLVKLVGAGLRGGGHPVSDDDLRSWPAASVPEMAAAAASLLAATFGDAPENPPKPQGA